MTFPAAQREQMRGLDPVASLERSYKVGGRHRIRFEVVATLNVNGLELQTILRVNRTKIVLEHPGAEQTVSGLELTITPTPRLQDGTVCSAPSKPDDVLRTLHGLVGVHDQVRHDPKDSICPKHSCT